MKKILAMSIWAPGAIPVDEWKYRNLKRITIPVIDMVLFIGGLGAAVYGIPAISEFFNRATVDSYSTLFAVAALACFLGIAFPHLWGLEILGRGILVGLLFGYFLSMAILFAEGSGDRQFVLTFIAIAIACQLWRMSLIGTEWKERRLERKEQS